MEVRVSFVGDVPRFSTATGLFPLGGASELTVFDATADGKRILASSSKTVAGTNSLSLVVNWQKTLGRR